MENLPTKVQPEDKPELRSDHHDDDIERLLNRKQTISRVIDKLLEKLNPPPASGENIKQSS